MPENELTNEDKLPVPYQLFEDAIFNVQPTYLPGPVIYDIIVKDRVLLLPWRQNGKVYHMPAPSVLSITAMQYSNRGSPVLEPWDVFSRRLAGAMATLHESYVQYERWTKWINSDEVIQWNFKYLALQDHINDVIDTIEATIELDDLDNLTFDDDNPQ